MPKSLCQLIVGLTLCGPFGLLAVAPALAEGPVNVKVNMARVLRLAAPAATVIIGNPGVADVTIQDPQTLVLTGKSYGQTNLIVLDSGGEPIADTVVEVVQAQDDTVTVFLADIRTTLSCAPICAPTIMVGDHPDYAAAIVDSLESVKGSQK